MFIEYNSSDKDKATHVLKILRIAAEVDFEVLGEKVYIIQEFSLKETKLQRPDFILLREMIRTWEW